MFSFSIIPKDEAFFALFDESGNILLRTAEAYQRFTKPGVDPQAQLEVIRRLEHEGDTIVHETLLKLDKTILTPFDREDISVLMKRVDDVIDDVDAAAKRYCMYRIPKPTDWLIKQTDVLTQACGVLASSIPQLRNLRKPEALRSSLLQVNALEKTGDDHHHAAIVDLYDHTPDPILVMKWKEVYDLTERAIDRCEDIANVMLAIILKNG